MGMRRMTRLTNAFSKKWENLEAAYALWFAYYNWCRKHQTLRDDSGDAAGIDGSPVDRGGVGGDMMAESGKEVLNGSLKRDDPCIVYGS